MSDKKPRDMLLDQYRKARKAQSKGGEKEAGDIKRITHMPRQHDHSYWKSDLLKNHCSWVVRRPKGRCSLRFGTTLKKNRANRVRYPQNMHERHQMYRDVAGNLCLTRYCTIMLDVFPQLRDGTSLVLKNVNGKVTKKESKTPIIGCGVLESPGCDNWAMLLAARAKFGDKIDVIERLVEQGNEEERTLQLQRYKEKHCSTGRLDW